MTPIQKQALIGVIVAVCSYFFGNINWAIAISKMKGRDIRKCGSGNPGTMNMLRSFGKALGVLTLVLDVMKGVVPCILGWLFMGDGEFCKFGDNYIGMYVAGFAAVLGHIYPVTMKFKGGKGAASIIGVCLTIQPLYTVGFFVVGVLFLFVTKIGSLTSFIIIVGPMTAEGVMAAGSSPWELAVISSTLVFATFALSLFAHRSNLVKLFSGREGQVVLKKSKKAKPQIDRSVLFEDRLIAE